MFFIEDIVRGGIYCDKLTATNEADALKEAWRAWSHLTACDQRKRDSFALCCGDPENDSYVVIDIAKAAPVYAAFDADAADIRAGLETEMAEGYRQSMDADLELRLDDLREWYKEQYPELF